uniref:S1-like domain-containing protein n=1 Tax=Setaria digitata TaxID=48799 RepID=A0A915PLG1_9BILA
MRKLRRCQWIRRKWIGRKWIRRKWMTKKWITRKKLVREELKCRKKWPKKGLKYRKKWPRRGPKHGKKWSERKLKYKESGQEYAKVIKVMSHGRLIAKGFDDDKQRLCRIRGRIRWRIHFEEDDIILISLREFQDSKADVIMKYNRHEAQKLKACGQIPANLQLKKKYSCFKEVLVDFGNVHGSMTHVGKVRSLTPYVRRQDKKKKKKKTGRAARRIQYFKRFIDVPSKKY